MKPPSTVPCEAIWDAVDSEWVLGPKDEEGEYHGDVNYWRGDGTLVCICAFENGVPHGKGRRFHENGEVSVHSTFVAGKLEGLQSWHRSFDPTTEQMPKGADFDRVEFTYLVGTITNARYFLKDDIEVTRNGSPLATRPDTVPPEAMPNLTGWMVGTWNDKGQKHGELRFFDHNGTTTSIEMYHNDQLHGYFQSFSNGLLRARTEYKKGKREGAFEQYAHGKLVRSGSILEGKWDRPLEDFDEDGTLIYRLQLPVASKANPATPSVREIEQFSDCQWPPSSTLLQTNWSPAAVARFLAVGWGGDTERDAGLARCARALVRALAGRNTEIETMLHTLGFDKAPRIFTTSRLRQLLDACVELTSVDSSSLEFELIARGGTAEIIALQHGDAAAEPLLRKRLSSTGTLDLSGQSLATLPPVLAFLPSITSLDASHNRLRTLPDEVASLPFLEKIDLDSCQITDVSTRLTRLQELRNLRLSNNCLKRLPDIVTRLVELETINLGNNQLTELPDDFCALSDLKTLWVNDNPLETLPSSFEKLRKLTFLHLGNTPWHTPPECIWQLGNLKELWLASSSLTHLPAEVGQLKKLERLHLWYSSLKEVPAILFEMTYLKELRISHNPLPPNTIELLKEALPNTEIF